jgi:hypothetical protein
MAPKPQIPQPYVETSLFGSRLPDAARTLVTVVIDLTPDTAPAIVSEVLDAVIDELLVDCSGASDPASRLRKLTAEHSVATAQLQTLFSGLLLLVHAAIRRRTRKRDLDADLKAMLLPNWFGPLFLQKVQRGHKPLMKACRVLPDTSFDVSLLPSQNQGSDAAQVQTTPHGPTVSTGVTLADSIHGKVMRPYAVLRLGDGREVLMSESQLDQLRHTLAQACQRLLDVEEHPLFAIQL